MKLKMDIEKETEELFSEFYDNNLLYPKTFSEVVQIFGNGDFSIKSSKVGFGVIKKPNGKPFNMLDPEKTKNIISLLIKGVHPNDIATQLSASRQTVCFVYRDFKKLCLENKIKNPIKENQIAPNGIGKTVILKPKRRGVSKKLNENLVREIRKMCKTETNKKVARKFGINPSTVAQIKKRTTWKWVI